MKKAIYILSLAALILSSCGNNRAKTGNENADKKQQETEQVIASGLTGDITWLIDNEGKLTIAPAAPHSTAAMPFGSTYHVPWYDFRSSITSVEIANGITSIGDCTFYHCENLKEFIVSEQNPKYSAIDGVLFDKNKMTLVLYPNAKSENSYVIPNSVTSIGVDAFQYCYELTSITILNSVTSIGRGAFAHCGRLTSIIIPKSVTSIGGYAFAYCYNLANIVIGDGVTSIEEGTFTRCYGLTNITIPNSVTSIGWGAFERCHGLTSITIPKSVISIGDLPFYYCAEFKEFIVSKQNPKYLAIDGVLFDKNKTTLILFPEAKSADSYMVPNGVTSIGEYAFSDCRRLTSITISNSVISIREAAFAECLYLTSITLGNSVASIERSAFEACSELTEIYSKNPIPPTIELNSFENQTTCKLYVPKGSLQAYKEATVWKDFVNIIEE